MEVDGVKIINTQLVSFFSIFVVEARPRGEVRFRPLPFLSPGGGGGGSRNPVFRRESEWNDN